MDLLFSRYASPFVLLDGFIHTGRFYEFVIEFIKINNQEKEEDSNWEFFLHKVWEGSYSDFRESIKTNKENQGMSDRTIETTIQESMNILKNFNPTREVKTNGTI